MVPKGANAETGRLSPMSGHVTWRCVSGAPGSLGKVVPSGCAEPHSGKRAKGGGDKERRRGPKYKVARGKREERRDEKGKRGKGEKVIGRNKA
ncbi:hypothetical protein NDU88_003435 [Pleurodeles waltl]|uniref:Uncharacterized protein n=1 Tax=Pleurodeles waltl TaxID=8319 RepID=A0AAV7NJ86_PLEWA|nr:hypothetical protein NDU88_003435 [Pleurodeles waltl]